jgi:hypothetical protein
MEKSMLEGEQSNLVIRGPIGKGAVVRVVTYG